jgi:cytosine/adenosine deaminase-related metal-dependent hydrolase
MAALREFDHLGGTIGSGDDAGFIYQIYGFGLLRDLELEEEAGFNPIKVIQHVTGNNARILGIDDKTGRVRVGYDADLIVVNGNPLENIKVLYPPTEEGQKTGVEWTIKDGYVYHAPTLAKEVREMVAKARAQRGKSTN